MSSAEAVDALVAWHRAPAAADAHAHAGHGAIRESTLHDARAREAFFRRTSALMQDLSKDDMDVVALVASESTIPVAHAPKGDCPLPVPHDRFLELLDAETLESVLEEAVDRLRSERAKRRRSAAGLADTLVLAPDAHAVRKLRQAHSQCEVLGCCAERICVSLGRAKTARVNAQVALARWAVRVGDVRLALSTMHR